VLSFWATALAAPAILKKNWSLSVKVGDLVRCINTPDSDFHGMVGIIVKSRPMVEVAFPRGKYLFIPSHLEVINESR
tara:strand:- start:438 stop:668 length:231 start_codon:yes stop_codon:yes gene_type:complete